MKVSFLFGVTLAFVIAVASSFSYADEKLRFSEGVEPITFGMVKKHIKIGESTQENVIRLFGSPDNMVLRKGKEMWIYDRFKVETNVSSESGYGTIIFAGLSKNTSFSSISLKTITVIIDFNHEGIVEDLNMRVGGY